MSEEQILELKETAKKTVEAVAVDIKKDLSESIQKDVNATLEKFKEDLENVENKEAFTELTEKYNKELEELKSSQKETLEILKKQGEALANQSASRESVYAKFQKAYEEKAKDLGENDKTDLNFSIKADNALTFTATDVAGGVYGTAAIPSAVANFTPSRLDYGIIPAARRVTRMLGMMSRDTLGENEQLIAISEGDLSGGAEIVGECEVKPYTGPENWVEIKKDAKTVAVLWKTSRKFRRQFARILPGFRRAIEQKFYIKMEDLILTDTDGILTVAPAFSPIAGFVAGTAPNRYDCIIAVAASLAVLEKSASMAILNPVDYAQMFVEKGSDNHYSIMNNGAILKIDQNGASIIYGSSQISIETSTAIAQGSLFVGDLSTIPFAAGNTLEFSQGYVNDDFERNLVTNRLELDYAHMADDDNIKSGLVYDTFDNITTQITG